MNDFPVSVLSYREHLSLCWQPGQLPLPSWEREQLDDRNLRLLTLVSILEEHRQRGDEATGVELELDRVQQKLDVLIELVGQLLPESSAAPCEVELSVRGAVWPALADGPASGASGFVLIRLHRSLAQPLRLAARIARSDDQGVCAHFEPLAEALQTALERHVFLHHRRAIAGARGSSGKSS